MFIYYHSNRGVKECWFVGAVTFYFQHQYNEDTHFLALVEVMKEHQAANYDKTTPVVKMNEPVEQQSKEKPDQRPIPPKYAVINVEDIIYQVGLIKSPHSDTVFKVIAPYLIFRRDMRSTAGHIKNL